MTANSYLGPTHLLSLINSNLDLFLDAKNKEHGRAIEVHKKLLSNTGLSGRISRQDAGFIFKRAEALNTINSIVAELSDSSCEMLNEIASINAQLVWILNLKNGKTKINHQGTTADNVNSVLETLKMREKMWSLSNKDQLNLARVGMLIESENLKNQIAVNNGEEKPTIDVSELLCFFFPIRLGTQALVENWKIDDFRSQLSSKAVVLLDKEMSAGIKDYAIFGPLKLTLNASTEDHFWAMQKLENLYEFLAVMPQHDPRLKKKSTKNRSEFLYKKLNENSIALKVIETWISALIQKKAIFQRCKLCHRHLGKSMKQFCREHARSADKRIDSRSLHIGRLYQNERKKLLPFAIVNQLSINKLNTGTRIHQTHLESAMLMLGEDKSSMSYRLVRPAAALGSFLYDLKKFMSVEIEQIVKDHFINMIGTARQYFLVSSSNFEESLRQKVKQKEVLEWLNWKNFFISFFGSNDEKKYFFNSIYAKEFLGFDHDHPITKDQYVSPQKIALDLFELKTWVSFERSFDQNSYIQYKQVMDLRQSSDGGKKLSLRKIAMKLGISHEAVRKILKENESLKSSGQNKNRRQRIIKSKMNIIPRN